MKYRKKPVIIDAISYEEFQQYAEHESNHTVDLIEQDWTLIIEYNGHRITRAYGKNDYIIPTLEGNHLLTKADMLITGIKGELYPCKKEIFALTYEQIEEDDE